MTKLNFISDKMGRCCSEISCNSLIYQHINSQENIRPAPGTLFSEGNFFLSPHWCDILTY